jgi:valyl-tRNA synthetase
LQEAESLDMADLQHGDIHVGSEPPADAENWVQDEDVLDTWFSSWLWPYATMDEATRAKFYPTSDLSTGPDIIFFWVARMIMAGLEFMDEVPFRNVYFHSIVRDLKGRKMSKSLGNSPDPLDLIDKYGADGLRLGLMRIAPTGQDVHFDEKQIEEGRNFANKLWNASRYRLMQGDAGVGSLAAADRPAQLSIFAIDILAKLDALSAGLEKAYADYKFNDAASQIYEFFWANFCDLYLEAIKNDFRDEGGRKQGTLWTMDVCLARLLQLLHPYMPHVTEELWEKLAFVSGDGGFLMQTPLPASAVLAELSPAEIAAAQDRAAAVYESSGRVRNLKAEYGLASNKKVRLIVKPAGDWVSNELDVLALLSGAAEAVGEPGYEPEKGTPAAVTAVGEIYLPLEGLIDVEAERSRLRKEIEKVAREVSKCENKLGNARFVENAKPEVVETERGRLRDWNEKLTQLQTMIDGLA